MRAHLTWLFNSSSDLGFLTTFSQYLNTFIFLERDFNLLNSSKLILKIDCFGFRQNEDHLRKIFLRVEEGSVECCKISLVPEKSHSAVSAYSSFFLRSLEAKISSVTASHFALGSSSENVINGLNVCKALQIPVIKINLIIS